MRRLLEWLTVGLSFLLWIITGAIFLSQPDRLAAFTLIPLWFWGGIGLSLSGFACYFLRARFSLLMTVAWIGMLVVGLDEAKALRHPFTPSPAPGKAANYDGKPVIRVLTLNSFQFQRGSPLYDIVYWQPDIVLIQEVMPQQVKQLAADLYGKNSDFAAGGGNGVLSRWEIRREVRSPGLSNLLATIMTPDGRTIEIANLHLASACTNLALWRREAWVSHHRNRDLRKANLAMNLEILKTNTQFPQSPTLLGGDFNSAAGDPVHRLLAADFVNAFDQAGTGWSNTYHRRLPILRIDHVYATRHFTPVRCRAYTTRHSDHRMVVADFLFPSNP